MLFPLSSSTDGKFSFHAFSPCCITKKKQTGTGYFLCFDFLFLRVLSLLRLFFPPGPCLYYAPLPPPRFPFATDPSPYVDTQNIPPLLSSPVSLLRRSTIRTISPVGCCVGALHFSPRPPRPRKKNFSPKCCCEQPAAAFSDLRPLTITADKKRRLSTIFLPYCVCHGGGGTVDPSFYSAFCGAKLRCLSVVHSLASLFKWTMASHYVSNQATAAEEEEQQKEAFFCLVISPLLFLSGSSYCR